MMKTKCVNSTALRGSVLLVLAACVALPASPVPGTAIVTSAAGVPLADAVADMEPQAVWQNFYDLTQVPRPSHHEEQVRAFLVEFGEGLGLETIVDNVGNVLIRKPAASGLEDRRGVVLQAHMDMVAQKTEDSDHDFLTDPITAYVEDGWVVTGRTTTLGADDGIGVAMAMAVLQSETPSLGAIEALFTVNEEDGMDGALGLQPGVLQGTTLINLDWETEGIFTIGSAGGDYIDVNATYTEVEVPSGVAAYTVTVSGLLGGHSGMNINLGRGHATKLLVRLLTTAADTYGARIASIEGGTAANAIPTTASSLLVVPEEQVDAFLAYVKEFEGIVQTELATTEPGLIVEAAGSDLPTLVLDETAQHNLLNALYATPQGVIRMSDDVDDLVETSTNMGIVTIADGQVIVTCYPRSSVDTELDDINRMIASVWDMMDIDVTISNRFSGWTPNTESPILLLMEDVYEDMYGVAPELTAVHAGLECGTIVALYPGMDAISVGPTLEEVHTVNEQLEVSTVQKLYDFLFRTLQEIE
jgi:dipeptidase D